MAIANDNARESDRDLFGASASALFLPAAIVFLVYGGAALGLALAGHGNGELTRLCVLAAGVAAPILFAHAVLRGSTLLVEVAPHGLLVRNRLFASARHVAWRDIRSVSVRSGPASALTGSSALVIDTVAGERFAIGDLADASGAREAIETVLENRKTDAHGAPEPETDESTSIRRATGR